jgi:hypothetical protein
MKMDYTLSVFQIGIFFLFLKFMALASKKEKANKIYMIK